MAIRKNNRGLVETSLEELESKNGSRATSPAGAKALGSESPEQAAAAGTPNHIKKTQQADTPTEQTLQGYDRLTTEPGELTEEQLATKQKAIDLKGLSGSLPDIQELINTRLDDLQTKLADPNYEFDQAESDAFEALVAGKVIDAETGKPLQREVYDVDGVQQFEKNPDGTDKLDEEGNPIPLKEEVTLSFSEVYQLLPAENVASLKASAESVGISEEALGTMTPDELLEWTEREKAKEFEKADELREKLADPNLSAREYDALAGELKDMGAAGYVVAEGDVDEAIERSKEFIEEVGTSPEAFGDAVAGDDAELSTKIAKVIKEGSPDTVDDLVSHDREGIQFADEVEDAELSSDGVAATIDGQGEDGFHFGATVSFDGETHEVGEEELELIKDASETEGYDIAVTDETTGDYVKGYAFRNDGEVLDDDQMERVIDNTQVLKDSEEVAEEADEILEDIPLDEEGNVVEKDMTDEQKESALTSTLNAMGINVGLDRITENMNLVFDKSFMAFDVGDLSTKQKNQAREVAKLLDNDGDGKFTVNDVPALIDMVKDSTITPEMFDSFVKTGEGDINTPLFSVDPDKAAALGVPYSLSDDQKKLSSILRRGRGDADDVAMQIGFKAGGDIGELEKYQSLVSTPAFKKAYPEYAGLDNLIGKKIEKSKRIVAVNSAKDAARSGVLDSTGNNRKRVNRFFENPERYKNNIHGYTMLEALVNELEVQASDSLNPEVAKNAKEALKEFPQSMLEEWEGIHNKIVKERKKEKDGKALKELYNDRFKGGNMWSSSANRMAYENMRNKFKKEYGLSDSEVNEILGIGSSEPKSPEEKAVEGVRNKWR